MDAPPDLPAAVHVTTGTRATTMDAEYAVHDGRVFTKKKGAPAAAWHLIDDDGRPDRQDQPYDFTPIARVSADDAGITATTTGGYLVRFNPSTSTAAEAGGTWDGLWGLPAPGVGVRLPIQLPATTRSVAHSVRRGAVEYYEDTLGNQFNWGFAGTTSLYVLADDGRRILLGDPWLAPDLSRQVCGPLRGAFRAEGLAASASTLMVIGDDGQVFTTFHDYDSDGGTPFINYAYFERAPRHGLAGSLRDSEYEVRALPAEEWTRQPDLPPARLTRNIAVLQNGKGNRARELRVQAQTHQGARGYFMKQLASAQWTFRETGEAIDAETFLDGHDASGAIVELSFTGDALLGGAPWSDVARVEARHFQFHCSPFLLDLHVAGGGVVSLAIHAADAWTPFAQADAETDPLAYKSLKGTVVVRGITRPAGDSHAFARVLAMFQRMHLESFTYAGVASQRALELVPLHRTLGTDPWRPTLRLARALTAPTTTTSTTPTTTTPARTTPAPVEREARVALRRAIVALDDAREREARESADAAKARTIASGGKLASGLLNAVTAASTAPDVAWMRALELHMPAITQTMVRVQQLEADDAMRARVDLADAVAPAYCAAFTRMAPSIAESALWDGELLRRCPR